MEFKTGNWETTINVRDFIQRNYLPYSGDQAFLEPPTSRTKKLWEKVSKLLKQEQEKGILDLDVNTPSTVTSHKAGYIDKTNELIFGLQTESPLKRAIKPNGGIRLVEKAAEAYGYKIPEKVSKIFSKYRKTHNEGVFNAYSDKIKWLRKKHIITGLPDNYSRGRIIGDYRRMALYGTDRLIEQKEAEIGHFASEMSNLSINLREELSEQIKALKDISEMAKGYGFDISKPAKDSREAIQWTYFAYLAATKQQDGAAMSFGRIDSFLDIFIERDLKAKKYSEIEIQEFLDDFIIKLRIIRHLRPPEYNELFAGDPTWITLAIGGTGIDGRPLVTKTSYRLLHSLTNLGPAPEPNLTVLWDKNLPQTFKDYCAKQSINTSSIQYENDLLMKQYYGDDYAIACCVSGMELGNEMQFFGARANLPKVLLLAINGGKEEPTEKNKGKEPDIVIPGLSALNQNINLDYEQVWKRFKLIIDIVAEQYVNAMNVIHFMHDKYNYESAQMAFHNTDINRNMAFGLAGLSVVADSLSAIKHAKVEPTWNKHGVATDYKIAGDFPTFGNDNDDADNIAIDVVKEFFKALKKHKTYRDSKHTLSILTITSNVVYGKATGATPDGRRSGVPFAPGANPMHGRDQNGALASLNSVAKIPYEYCQDGISNTFSIVPNALGRNSKDQIKNLAQLLDGYIVGKNGHHLNVNVINSEKLRDAQKHPEKYPQLTIRVSGYAVLFNRLNKEQQDEVIARTFHT